MQEKKHNTPNRPGRRQFISNTIKIALLGTIITPLDACNDKSPGKDPTGPGDQKKKTKSGSKKTRKKWSHESLVMNEKTKVIHFPTSKLYHYYDEIKPKHLKEISMATWTVGLGESMRLNKQQSGNITEILTLQELGKGVNDTALVVAIDTLSVAFQKDYEKENARNFRLHELMLQLVTLNGMIPADQKWQTFSAKVVNPSQLRKRQKWMESETNFNARVKYISDRSDDYKNRLSKRAKKYSFN